MLPPSGAKRLRKMILPHMSGGRAPPGSGLGAKPPYAGVTIATFRLRYIQYYSRCTAVEVHVHVLETLIFLK